MLSTGLLLKPRFPDRIFDKTADGRNPESTPFDIKWVAVAVALCIRTEYVHRE